MRRENGKDANASSIRDGLWGAENRFKGAQKRRNSANEFRNFAETRQARIAEADIANMAGDYEQRRT